MINATVRLSTLFENCFIQIKGLNIYKTNCSKIIIIHLFNLNNCSIRCTSNNCFQLINVLNNKFETSHLTNKNTSQNIITTVRLNVHRIIVSNYLDVHNNYV